MTKPNQRFQENIEKNFANVEDPDNIDTTFVGVKTEKIDTTSSEPLSEGQNEENVTFTGLDHLAETVKTMVEKSQNLEELEKRGQRACTCKVCGKEGDRKHIKIHIEKHHLGKFSIPCNECNEKSNSSKALRSHIIKYHDQ